MDYSVAKVSELCSTFYILKLFYEYPRSDLRREMGEKRKNNVYFTDAEITHLLYHQLNAMNYMNQNNLSHGDIQPLFIGWD